MIHGASYIVINRKAIILKNKGGFTLAEMMVVVAIFGLLSLGMVFMMEEFARIQVRDKTSLSVDFESLEIKKYMEISQSVSWGFFNPDQSYFLKNDEKDPTTSIGSKVKWTLKDVPGISKESDIQFKVAGFDFYRNSHSIEIPRIEGENRAIISRCVKRKTNLLTMTTTQALALDRVPLIKFSGNKMRVYCCPKGAQNLCSEEVNRPSSHYRVVTLLVHPKNVKKYPALAWVKKGGEKVGADSLGFMLFFNRPKNPSSYRLVVFTHQNLCLRKSKKSNCNDPFIVKNISLSGTVKKQAINDTGLLKIR